MPIRLVVGELVLEGELLDTQAAAAVAAALPLEATLRSFGDSFYMETPVTAALGPDASDEVAVGDLAFWPAALAVCVFFGPTPQSEPGSEVPVAASDVAVLGRVRDARRLATVRDAPRMRLERA